MSVVIIIVAIAIIVLWVTIKYLIVSMGEEGERERHKGEEREGGERRRRVIF